MGIFNRNKWELEMLPVEGHDDLVSVPRNEIEEGVNVLAIETRQYVDEVRIGAQAARALSVGFFLVTGREVANEETLAAARAIARFGYMARVAEWERLTTARKPRGWMIVALREAVESSVEEDLKEGGDPERSFYDSLRDVTAFFVRREPVDVPYDAEEGFALMWTIPGMGGEIRGLLRDKTLSMVLQRDGEGLRSSAGRIEGVTVEDFQRIWKYGFLLRSFEEFFWED